MGGIHYSVDFKKQVVKKLLEEGIHHGKLAEKLGVSRWAISDWKKRYSPEVKIDPEHLNSVFSECKVSSEVTKDLNTTLLNAEQKALEKELNTQSEVTIDKILEDGKTHEQLTLKERCQIVEAIREMTEQERGKWLRAHGLFKQHITLWEKELFDMAKKNIKDLEYIKRLEEENKKLKKELTKSVQREGELKTIIELKKKYKHLFESGEDA